MTARLVLVRHGEIIRPANTSNFDRAPLSERGEIQIRALARAWPVDPPTAIFASPLRRSLESAILLSQVFGLPFSKRPCLKEWSPDDSGIPQPEYAALETLGAANRRFGERLLIWRNKREIRPRPSLEGGVFRLRDPRVVRRPLLQTRPL